MGKHFERIKRYKENFFDLSEGSKKAEQKQKANKNQNLLFSILLGLGFLFMFYNFFIGIILIVGSIIGFIFKRKAYIKR